MAWYKNPVMITEGKMQYLFDETGRRQNHLLQHTTNIYLNNEIAEYAQELTAKLPGKLNVAYFVNSGSEANDMAILMARLYSGNHDLIALRNGYHGISEGLLGVLGHSTWKYNVPSAGLIPDSYIGMGNKGTGCFAPSAELTNGMTFGWEFFLSFILVATVYACAIGAPNFGNVAPLAVGVSLALDIMAGAAYSGSSVSPARVLGPAIVFHCHWNTAWGNNEEKKYQVDQGTNAVPLNNEVMTTGKSDMPMMPSNHDSAMV
ncbi:MAG: alanine-glyoxylate transaminase [Trebouxia sp. A1-2]|nr:MAG: alanine-glyoxylate transaminase [Trebouxia sp. A1-2]